MGIPQGFQRVRDVLTNRRGNRPGLERRDPLKRIADPENLESENPAIKKAAEVKKAEDMKAQKIKAIKYLAKIGCGCYDKDGEVTAALLAAMDDCTPDVREAAIEAVEDAAGCECCKQCGSKSCCNEEITAKLSEIAYEKDDTGCSLEPNADVRRAAARALCKCCPGGPPMGPIEEETADPDTDPDAEPIPVPEPGVQGEEGEDDSEVEGEEGGLEGEKNEQDGDLQRDVSDAAGVTESGFAATDVPLSEGMMETDTEFQSHAVHMTDSGVAPFGEPIRFVEQGHSNVQPMPSIKIAKPRTINTLLGVTRPEPQDASDNPEKLPTQMAEMGEAPLPVNKIGLPTGLHITEPIVGTPPRPVRAIPLVTDADRSASRTDSTISTVRNVAAKPVRDAYVVAVNHETGRIVLEGAAITQLNRGCDGTLIRRSMTSKDETTLADFVIQTAVSGKATAVISNKGVLRAIRLGDRAVIR